MTDADDNEIAKSARARLDAWKNARLVDEPPSRIELAGAISEITVDVARRHVAGQGRVLGRPDATAIELLVRWCWLGQEVREAFLRDALGAVKDAAALEAVALSAPGSAWSQFATVELGRRRGEVADWSYEAGAGLTIRAASPGEGKADDARDNDGGSG